MKKNIASLYLKNIFLLFFFFYIQYLFKLSRIGPDDGLDFLYKTASALPLFFIFLSVIGSIAINYHLSKKGSYSSYLRGLLLMVILEIIPIWAYLFLFTGGVDQVGVFRAVVIIYGVPVYAAVIFILGLFYPAIGKPIEKRG